MPLVYAIVIVLQYYFDGPEVNVVSKPHGLSKRSEPYFRTPKTALKHMRDVASHSTPKEALMKLTREQGGEIKTGRPASLPRNRQQLQNLRCSATSHDSNVLYTILHECKLAQGTTDAFIRHVKAAPTPQSVLFFDWQLKELKKFLTNNCNFGIFNVDTAFNLGNFCHYNTISSPHAGMHSLWKAPFYYWSCLDTSKGRL